MQGLEASARRANDSDLETLVELRRAARESVFGVRGGRMYTELDRPPTETAVAAERALRDGGDRWLVLIGSLGQVPVGYILCQTHPSSSGEKIAVIDEFFVEAQAREVGVGEALMNETFAWAKTQGCTGIDAVALPGDRETKNFFESFRLTARAIVVHRTLEPGDAG